MRPEYLHRALAGRGRRQHSRNPRVGTSDPVRTGSCAQSLSNFPAVPSLTAGAFLLCSDGSPEGDIYPAGAPAQRVGFLSAATKDQHHVFDRSLAVVASATARVSPRSLASMPGARDAGSAWSPNPSAEKPSSQGLDMGAARTQGINRRRGTASPRPFQPLSGGVTFFAYPCQSRLVRLGSDPSRLPSAARSIQGGRGCQCLQRLCHAERTGREPRARPAVTGRRDGCFWAGSRPSHDPNRRDVTRRDADQSLTVGRDRHASPAASSGQIPGPRHSAQASCRGAAPIRAGRSPAS